MYQDGGSRSIRAAMVATGSATTASATASLP
jgi:hypothetical protein